VEELRFDRDLSIAGRVIVSKKGDAGFVSKLIKIDRPLLRIPTLGESAAPRRRETVRTDTW
jgi:aspartyl aminopeptidase